MSSFWYYVPGMLILSAAALLMSFRLIHYFQLESYQFRGYFKTLLRQKKKAVFPLLLIGAGVFAISFLLSSTVFPARNTVLGALMRTISVCVPACVCTFLLEKRRRAEKEKKPLRFTARVKRLAGILAAVLFLVQLILTLVSEKNALGCYGILIAFLPVILSFAALIALPVEKLIFRMYFEDARKKLLKDPDLIRIGITGSYGKTSTKFVLATLLSQKYNVLYTPSSFNTPMGVTRVVRERLEPGHQVFIGEMGARHVGEIKELSRLVTPRIGILTSVGPQHLDTFGSIERVKKTKYELIEALPEDGLAVFSDDGGIVRELYEKTVKPKLLVGTPGSDAWAENVNVSSEGSSFTLCLKGMEPIECTSMMLGKHNIRNIVVAAAVAKYLGLTRAQIRMGISAVRPVEHRLQLMRTPGGVTVIDDAFNTNPRSSANAMEILGTFSGRRIVVTPGMVELGKDEEKFNYEFGRAITGNADLVFLIGKKHTEPIMRGLKDSGTDEKNIFVFASLDEATAKLNHIMRPGDVIMYENDLPDNYSEN